MKRFWSWLSLILLVFSLVATSAFSSHSASAVAPAWDGNYRAYAVGDLVTYNGVEYRCIQAHTSQPDWTPAAVASLWTATGGTSPATSTPRPTTNPTVAPTQPPTSGCTAPAWSNTPIYTGGNTVSYNGKEYRAKWWTQGETPGTTGQWGVWEDLGSCGDITPSPTPQTTTPVVTATPSPISSAAVPS